MIRRPPRSTRTYTLVPYTPLFRAVGLDFFLRLFLLGVVRVDFQLPGRTLQAHAAILLVGQDRRALQRRAQDLAVDADLTVGADRDRRLVMRKSAVTGKSVSVRVELGGRRIIKKQTHKKSTYPHIT